MIQNKRPSINDVSEKLKKMNPNHKPQLQFIPSQSLCLTSSDKIFSSSSNYTNDFSIPAPKKFIDPSFLVEYIADHRSAHVIGCTVIFFTAYIKYDFY